MNQLTVLQDIFMPNGTNAEAPSSPHEIHRWMTTTCTENTAQTLMAKHKDILDIV